MGKSSSPTHQPQLVRMLEDECHNSFLKLPDEEPIHIWNTDEVEGHNQRMKKLDKKLAKHNNEISKLKDLLRQADEARDARLDRMEQREEKARQETLRLKEATQAVQQEAMSTERQYAQLQVRLAGNMHAIKVLRAENKVLVKAFGRVEKQRDKLQSSNSKLEESSNSLLNSYSDLCLGSSKVFDDNNFLCDTLEEGREDHESLKLALQAWQERYMEEAQQRLEMQKAMAEILTLIQSAGPVRVPAQLANECTHVGLLAEARSIKRMQLVDKHLEAIAESIAK